MSDFCPRCKADIPEGVGGEYTCACGAALVIGDWAAIRSQIREMVAAGDAAGIELAAELERQGVDVLGEDVLGENADVGNVVVPVPDDMPTPAVSHVYETHRSIEECYPREGYCTICEGGLSVCTVCGLAEGSLTSECPGVPSYKDHADAVYAGQIDFIDGRWVTKVSPYAPDSVITRKENT